MEKLKYYTIKFCSELGEENQNTNNILSTKKLGCPAYLKFLLKNTNLIITDLDNDHLNHHNIYFNNIEYSHNKMDMCLILNQLVPQAIKCQNCSI